ncbi:FAD-binding oxidoreductase [Streptosporangium sp. CA-135522]|uniref:FAD-binding oxidoreductase n=1 Tax=Streptosporangium sp. CA-135522 TaxID=3240072 RepID=UPI003D8EAA48
MSQHVEKRTHRSHDAGFGGDDVSAAARRLRLEFGGAVHLPGEIGYDTQRQPLHPTIDPRPAMVAEASGTADVRATVVAAREHDLPLAVQATGHGTHVPSDGGILLKTSAMTTVLVDADRRIARVAPGARWGEVIAAAAPFGLAPLAGSAPDVGVTGYTLGGGVGWLARKYGFAADSVLRAEVITADGRLVTASADSHPELFWALRGGGGNFGVVTALEFRLYPVTQVYAGVAYFAIESGAETLVRYREWAAGAPDDISTALLLTRMPDAPQIPESMRGRRVLAIKVMHAGQADEARRLLRPLWASAGPALLDGLRPMSFGQAAMGGTAARHLDLVHELSDPVIDILVKASEQAGTVEIRHWGGAMAHPRPGAGPVGHRTVPFSLIVDAALPGLAAALRPHATGGSFLNFLTDPTKTETAYTADDHRRLREVKRAYDPDNVFRLNHNVPPARPGAAAGTGGRRGVARQRRVEPPGLR